MRSELGLSEQRIRNNRIRRRRELRRRKRVGVLVLFVTVLFLSTFFSLRTRAEGSQNETLSKYYTSIQVRSGDTLWGYARQYGNRQYYKNSKEYIEEVMAINSLKDDTITAGQHIILPYYRSASVKGSIDKNSHFSTEAVTVKPLASMLPEVSTTSPEAGLL